MRQPSHGIARHVAALPWRVRSRYARLQRPWYSWKAYRQLSAYEYTTSR
eukprot:SAG11_NODE_18967_length_477_cov_0.550265_2_plen_48_part_01